MVLLTYKVEETELTMLKEVYQSVGWMKHDESVIRKVFNASTHKVFAVKDHQIIGFARALSDGLTSFSNIPHFYRWLDERGLKLFFRGSPNIS